MKVTAPLSGRGPLPLAKLESIVVEAKVPAVFGALVEQLYEIKTGKGSSR